MTEALALVEKNGERFYKVEVYWLKGELLLNDERRRMNDERQTGKAQSLHSRVKEAEACSHEALEIGHQQSVKSWELCTATSLARLWQQQGKQAEARALLASVYQRFTEGCDTKDLQEAKTLLEELDEGTQEPLSETVERRFLGSPPLG